MWVSRIQVSGGFLDGLDVSLADGLNVLIGARGTGKTSVIELIRFCLDAPLLTEAARTRGFQQAESVLAGGRVSVTLTDGSEAVEHSRQAGEPSEANAVDVSVVVLAQNEIEAVAASASGRLALLDRLLPETSELNTRESRLQAALRSQTEEIAVTLQEGLALDAAIDELSDVPQALAAARERQAELLERVAATGADRSSLEDLQKRGSQLAAQIDTVTQSTTNLAQWVSAVERLEAASRQIVAPWPASAGASDRMADVRSGIARVSELLEQAKSTVEAAHVAATEVLHTVTLERVALDRQSGDLRLRLESLEAGASQVTRDVTSLEDQNARRDALNVRIAERRNEFRRLLAERRRAYQDLDDARGRRFQLRADAANDLNRALMPTIKVTVRSSVDTSDYASQIVRALRGSGLHYNNLAPLIAQRMAPIELVESVELGDGGAIASATGIASDRAAALIAALRQGGLSEIVSSQISDGVSMELLDGLGYKSTEDLSIGQRCTVVLPILFAARSSVLLIDQPEDHLDNAFIVSTLVASLRRRRSGDQYIFTSHNANIPVLGEANEVVVMGSNGRRGYVETVGRLTSNPIVAAISTVMEGGTEAFETRAEFYRNGVL